MTIFIREAIQRVYATTGKSCVKSATVEATTMITINESGAVVANTCLIIQLIMSGISLILYIPWLISNTPVGPAMRAIKESIYFTTLLGDSNYSEHLRGLCNAPTHAIWQALDVVVRVGESVATRDDEVGFITLDKPKFVRELTNGRKYA